MVCAYTRPRYQVNVYMTIGTLVFSFLVLLSFICGESGELASGWLEY